MCQYDALEQAGPGVLDQKMQCDWKREEQSQAYQMPNLTHYNNPVFWFRKTHQGMEQDHKSSSEHQVRDAITQKVYEFVGGSANLMHYHASFSCFYAFSIRHRTPARLLMELFFHFPF